MGRRLLRPAGLAVLACVAASPVFAQGSSVYNQSACVSAKGGAAVAAPCMDGSSIYYNPALISMLPSAASAGFSAIYNTGSFTYDTTGVVVERDPAVPVVPQAYVAFRLGESKRLGAGIGLWAPYGLGIEWPETFEGRFISWKSALRGIYIQPTVAYQIIPGKLAIGGGPQIALGGIELNQNVDAPVADDQLAALGVPLGTDIASANLAGSGVGIGGQIGIYYQVTDRLSLGARYMFPITVDLEGDADFEQILNPDIILGIPDATGVPQPVPLDALTSPLFESGGSLSDQGATSQLTFPPQAVVGLRFGVTDKLDLSYDYQWTGWSTFDELVASFDGGAPDLALILNYVDAHTFRTGLTYDLSPTVQARGGWLYNTAATPDETVTPVLPEAERQLYGLGLGWKLGAMRADLYYNYVWQADRRGRVRTDLPPSFFQTPIEELNIGVYSATVHIVGLTFSYVFGDR